MTAVRLWLHAPDAFGGEWDNRITARCRWCGKLFPVESHVLGVIAGITPDAELSSEQAPCLELLSEAWEESGLMSECPDSHQLLGFDPFVADKRDRWEN